MPVAANAAGPCPHAPPRPQSFFFDGQLHRQLFPELFRPLSGAERDRLRASLRADGLLVPIVKDEHGQILDGWERLLLLFELGREAELRFDVRRFLTFAEKRRLAVALNDARRHLTPAEREQLAVALRKEGKSMRAIAAQIGVSPATVGRDLAAAGNPTPARVVGLDGRSHPAMRTPPEALIARQAEARRLRNEEGLILHEIAARLGVSAATVVQDLDAAQLTVDLADLKAKGLRDERLARPRTDKQPAAVSGEKVRCPHCRKLFELPE